MTTSNLTLPQVRAIGLALSTLALAVTCFRLWDRTKTRRLWWDDAWALAGMLFLSGYVGIFAVYLDNPEKYSRSVRATLYLSGGSLFYCVVWSSRISILFTIIRLHYGTARKVLEGIAILFGLSWVILISQVFWICQYRNTSWRQTESALCFLGLEAALTQLFTNIFSDCALIATPVWIVYRSTILTKAQKLQLAALFSTTIITTIFSIAHSYYVLTTGGIMQLLFAVVEAPTSLFVANLSVVFAALFRLSASHSATEEEQAAGPGFQTSRLDDLGSSMDELHTLPALFNLSVQDMPVTSTFMTSDGRIRFRRRPEDETQSSTETTPSDSLR